MTQNRKAQTERRFFKDKTWMTEDVILSKVAEKKLVERGALPPKQQQKQLTLAEFVQRFWPVLEPGVELVWGWVFDAMCLHLEAAARRLLKKLVINVPPGTMKSKLVNVFFPAWVWAELNASERFLTVSFQESLSIRDSTEMRRLILSEEFQARYGERVKLTRDQNAKGQYDTTARGRRLVKPITAATGSRAGILLIDDPNNAAKIDSKAHREEIKTAYDRSLRMRGANQATFVQIVIMQRLHEEDLTGHLEQKGGWCVLRLPERYEPEYHTTTYLPSGELLWSDPRTERGQLLIPSYRSDEAVKDMEIDLGTYGAAGQLQQRPVPAGGGVIKSWWWRYHAPAALIASGVCKSFDIKVYDDDGTVYTVPCVLVETPEEFDDSLTSWDMAFKDKKDNDFVTGQVWSSKGAGFYLLDQIRERMSYVKTKAEVVRLADKWPDIDEHLIEDKANGPAIMSDLHEVLNGLIAYEPQGSKESRVNAQSSTIEAGNVYLPHPAIAPWVNSQFIPEWSNFPNGKNDDQIDPATQAIDRLKRKQKRERRKRDKQRAGIMPIALGGLDTSTGKVQSKWQK